MRCDGGLPIGTVPGVHRFVPTDRPAERIARCMAGLAMFGLGIALLIDANLGAAPWDVFHTGVSELTGVPVGTVIIVTGVLLLLLWIPLGESPGLGTVLNAFEIGLFVDVVLPVLPEPELLVPRVVMMLGGVVVIGAGSGLYIGAGLGPGPRDGLMTGLGRHGVSIQLARTGIEVLVLLAGVAPRRLDRHRHRRVRARHRPDGADLPAPPQHARTPLGLLVRRREHRLDAHLHPRSVSPRGPNRHHNSHFGRAGRPTAITQREGPARRAVTTSAIRLTT